MIRVRIHNKVILRFFLAVTLLCCSGMLFAESVWEGSAAVGRYGEFPATGYYAATNAFPRNTALVVKNLDNGNTSSVIVVDRVSQPGLFMLLSRDAAKELGLSDSDITQVRVVIEKKSTDLPSVVEDDMAFSPDPDLNPAVSASGVEDLAFLEDYIEDEPPEAEIDEETVEPETILPPLEEQPEEEETVEEIVEEVPPAPVLKTEEMETKIPQQRTSDFNLTEVPETPEVAKSEVVLSGFDSDSLIAPPTRSVSRSVKVAPEPTVAEAAPVGQPETVEAAPEVPGYSDIPQVPYPPERVVASAFEAPEDPFFEAPESISEEVEETNGLSVESFALVEPSEERLVSLVVASVPEEPVVAETEKPRITGYTAPSELLFEMAYADIPEVPVPDVPEISGAYLASASEAEEFTIADIPAPPEIVTEEQGEEEIVFAEPAEEETPAEVSEVPEVVVEEKGVPEEPKPEDLPVPGEIDLYLEPAEMRPPEPIEEIAIVEEEPPAEPPVMEEPEVTEETEEEPEAEVSAVAYGRFTVSAELVPARYYLQLGVFSEEGTARGAAARIGEGYPITIQKTASGEDARYKLFVGPLSPDESGALLYRFRSAGYRDAFVRVAN